MIRSAALFGMFASLTVIAAAYVSAMLPGGAPSWAPWAMAIATPGTLVCLMALGAVRRNRLGWLWLALGFTFVLLAGGFGIALYLPADTADTGLWLGLPPRAAVILYGVGILPFLVVPAAYALTFDELTLSDADLARIADSIAARGRR